METQTDGLGAAPTTSVNFDSLMQAIDTCQMALTSKIVQVQANIGLIHQDLDRFRERVDRCFPYRR